MFGTEVFGFCVLLTAFLSSRVIATVREKDKIRAQNLKIVGKILTQYRFNILTLKSI
jgi:hypothetical protein